VNSADSCVTLGRSRGCRLSQSTYVLSLQRTMKLMRFTRRHVMIGIVLVVWILLGPIGMAFSACAVMAGCGGACSLTSCLTPSLPTAALLPLGSVPVPRIEHPLMTLFRVPDPPPRSVPTTA
jgi:hypothetical protein